MQVSGQKQITHFIIRLTDANVWESMGKPCSCTQFIKSRIFYSKLFWNILETNSLETPHYIVGVRYSGVSVKWGSTVTPSLCIYTV